MNRNQRKYVPKFKIEKEKYEFEEVLPPRSRRFPFKTDKPMTNRCCYISPVCKDVELSTEDSAFFVDDHFNNLIKEQYDFDPAIRESIKRIKHLNKPLRGIPKVETSSQYEKQGKGSYIRTADGSQWHSIDNTNDIEEFLAAERGKLHNLGCVSTRDVRGCVVRGPVEESLHLSHSTRLDRSKSPDRIENIKISEVPQIKVIAEKFSKFKRNDVEIRKLEEKIVCMEYNVYDSNDENLEKPIQKMRAYFSLKPTTDNENAIKTLPSTIKHEFNISQEDLSKLNDKEIEIIDSKIAENKPYLDDLKRVLNRKQNVKKKKNTLDLLTLYQIAKYDSAILDESFYNNKLLSQKDLEEIKDLIIKRSMSSVHGLNRRTIRRRVVNDKVNVISQSIFEELLYSVNSM